MRSLSNRAGLPRVLLAALTLLAFANAIPNSFVWIDHWQIEQSGLIAHSWAELWNAFRQPLGSMPGWEGNAPYARPTVVALFSLVYWLAGPDPHAYHALGLLLHLGNVLLVYGLLGGLAIAPRVAWFVSAVFAVHPLQTAAVTWISGIADPLFAFFMLLALRCERARPRARLGRLLLCAAAWASFAVALGAKETAAVFPLVLAVTYACVPGSPTALSAGRLARRLAPYLALLAAFLLYRVAVLHGAAVGAEMGGVPLAVRLRTTPRLLMSYLTLPLRFGALTVCDDYPLSATWDGWTILATLGVVVLLAAFISSWRRLPSVALGLAWMSLTLLPVLNIVPILHYRADRFFYFPLIGCTLAVVALIDAGVERVRESSRRAALHSAMGVLAVLGVAVLAALTARRNTLFSDDITLFESTLQVSPWCREAHTALGDAYLRSGRAADAATQYEQALRPQSEHASYVVLPKVFINLGMAQLAAADYVAARTAFSEAHRLQPGLLHPLFGLGAANLALGQTPEAVTWLEQAYARDRDDPDVVFNLALGYDRLGRRQEAARLYRHYLDIAPRGRARALAQAYLLNLAQ